MTMEDNKQRLIHYLQIGKMRGYSYYTHDEQSSKQHATEPNRLIQYAIQKRNHQYIAYYFQVDVDQMEIHEDVAIEEQKEFGELESALEYLVHRGADLTRLAPFKGQAPF